MNKAKVLAICYSDIFKCPLRVEELSEKEINPDKFFLKKINENKIIFHDGWCFIKGKNKSVSEKLEKEGESLRKLELARKDARILLLIPWVKAVFLTGAVAVSNAGTEDDIDLMIITQKNRAWLSRFFCTVIFDLLKKRRRKKQLFIKDKYCLNLFLDEESLQIPKDERNLYTAHEIFQTKLLVEKNDEFKTFRNSNVWVKEFLPNYIYFPKNKIAKKISNSFFLIANIFNLLEKISYKIQYFYMKKGISREIIERRRIFFHPRKLDIQIEKEFKKRIAYLEM